MATWLTPDDPALIELWQDAPEDEDTLSLYLDAAKDACIAYAPELPANDDPEAPENIPASWRLAQAMQARNLYNAGLATPTGDLDGGSYGLTTFPLDWQVQQLLRPRRGMGAIL